MDEKYVRLIRGIEQKDDMIEVLEQALNRSSKRTLNAVR